MPPNDQERAPPSRARRDPLRTAFYALASLRLTVGLLAASTALVFFGTLDQVHIGILGAQEKYFESFLALWHYPSTWPAHDYLGWLALPMPGGYLLGSLLLVNLVCAHLRYFRASWKKLGIVFIHGGVVLLILGQLGAQLFQEEYMLWAAEGDTQRYLEHHTRDELVVIADRGNGLTRVVSFPATLLRDAPTVLSHPELPFELRVLGYHPNAGIGERERYPQYGPNQASRGIGAARDWVAVPLPVQATEPRQNAAAATVTVAADGENLGRWLLSTLFRSHPPLQMQPLPPQTFSYQGTEYTLALRWERRYLDFEVGVEEVIHETYPGSDIPRHFESAVHVENPATGEVFRADIYMNHPMRYDGLTFYQAQVAQAATVTMLQVVDNPARHMPYASSLVISLGLLIQFGLGAVSAYSRAAQRKAAA